MPELLLELFSEEIPARMQARAADDLLATLSHALAPELFIRSPQLLHGPRRIALAGEMEAETRSLTRDERGPRQGAPRVALDAFLRSKVQLSPTEAEEAHDALFNGRHYEVSGKRVEYVESGKGVFVMAKIEQPGRTASSMLAEKLPVVLRQFPWPKAMRWGGTSTFTWVRPLRRILCLFDGRIVHFNLTLDSDDGHGLGAGGVTEGHRLMAPGPFVVNSLAEWQDGLRERRVIVNRDERLDLIRQGIAELAAQENLVVVPDENLLIEIAGLVEWPVPLLAGIDDAFMDLPPEVMRTTMRANQKYVSLRHPDGRPAARFALAANVAAPDGGAAIIAGNERVLRARLSDARFFWDQDRRTRLESRLPALDSVVFHARLGTQGQRVARLERLAAWLAPRVGADPVLAARAARLAKADLATGMVGEFPELQGIMGRYYALHDGEAPAVAEAIAAHYRPAGPGDAVPADPVAIAVALADKLDQLAGFFAVDERPTGSGDPYALRRAALGVIRIIRENGLRLALRDAVAEAFFGFPAALGVSADPEFGRVVAAEAMAAGFTPDPRSAHPPLVAGFAAGVVRFLAERLRVALRAEGARHDVLAAVLDRDDDLNRLLARAQGLADIDPDLFAAYRRAQNILRIETRKDGPHDGDVDPALLATPGEQALDTALTATLPVLDQALAAEDFAAAIAGLAGLRGPVDAFFNGTVVNDPDPALRRNRLALLSRLTAASDRVADLSKLEG